MAKFFFFEKIVQVFYTHVFTAPKETYSKGTQLGVTFASGYLAGVVCAIVSHPADSLVSLLGKAENKGKSVGQIASETGVATLATKGLGTRVLMIGAYLRFVRTSEHDIDYSYRYPHWLPVVDLRHFQERHGYGYHWWQVIASHDIDSTIYSGRVELGCISKAIKKDARSFPVLIVATNTITLDRLDRSLMGFRRIVGNLLFRSLGDAEGQATPSPQEW
jgi:hypothetical protein